MWQTALHDPLKEIQSSSLSRFQVREATWKIADHINDQEDFIPEVIDHITHLLLSDALVHPISVVGVLYSADLALPLKAQPWLLRELEGPDVIAACCAAQMLSISGGCVLLTEYLSTKTSPHQNVLEALWKAFLQHECDNHAV